MYVIGGEEYVLMVKLTLLNNQNNEVIGPIIFRIGRLGSSPTSWELMDRLLLHLVSYAMARFQFSF